MSEVKKRVLKRKQNHSNECICVMRVVCSQNKYKNRYFLIFEGIVYIERLHCNTVYTIMVSIIFEVHPELIYAGSSQCSIPHSLVYTHCSWSSCDDLY